MELKGFHLIRLAQSLDTFPSRGRLIFNNAPPRERAFSAFIAYSAGSGGSVTSLPS